VIGVVGATVVGAVIYVATRKRKSSAGGTKGIRPRQLTLTRGSTTAAFVNPMYASPGVSRISDADFIGTTATTTGDEFVSRNESAL